MRGLVFLVALGLAACSAGPPLRSSATLPEAARASPQRFIVLTVHNPVTLPASRAASSPRGYDNLGPYLAGTIARALSRALAKDYGLRETAAWPIALLNVHCLVYEMPANADRRQLLAALAGDSRVESVQPLVSFETATGAYNDPYAQLQLNMQQMDVIAAHALSRGAGVRVAIIDTGVQTDHPDLPARLLVRNFVDNDAGSFRGDAHGTAVAGIIAAVPDNGIGIVGIAPDASLLAYKACWRASTIGIKAVCNTFTLAQAIAAAVEARADIINLSLDGPSDPLLTRLIRHALDAGIIVVGAVPPDGRRDAFPTDIAGVIAADEIENTHAIGADGAAAGADAAAPGAATAAADVVRAPGRDVLSLAPENHYDFYSGSSLATAEITGIIALLRAHRSHLTAPQAMALLTTQAQTVPNACAALGLLLHRNDCR
ncbi:MAG TPA: S8 family serine peptidase [Steroidobacteraceae bacterium]|nr:S8 family serine peptidase [Steroidobacteraceae bacterium]